MLNTDEWEQAHPYVLNNCDEVTPYVRLLIQTLLNDIKIVNLMFSSQLDYNEMLYVQDT